MFLANENFPRPGILLLREKGYKVISIQEEYAGIDDDTVMKIANESKYIILTFDSDYGELIFRYAKNNPPSVVYFREKGNTPLYAADTLIKLLQSKQINLENCFTIVSVNNIRQRFYKTPL